MAGFKTLNSKFNNYRYHLTNTKFIVTDLDDNFVKKLEVPEHIYWINEFYDMFYDNCTLIVQLKKKFYISNSWCLDEKRLELKRLEIKDRLRTANRVIDSIKNNNKYYLFDDEIIVTNERKIIKRIKLQEDDLNIGHYHDMFYEGDKLMVWTSTNHFYDDGDYLNEETLEFYGHHSVL